VRQDFKTTPLYRLRFIVLVESLKGQPYQSIETAYQVLFDGVAPIIDYSPVLKLAAEFFTHLGVACKQNSRSL